MALNNHILYGSKASANVLDVCMLTVLCCNKECDKIIFSLKWRQLCTGVKDFGKMCYVIIPKCWYMLRNT